MEMIPADVSSDQSGSAAGGAQAARAERVIGMGVGSMVVPLDRPIRSAAVWLTNTVVAVMVMVIVAGIVTGIGIVGWLVKLEIPMGLLLVGTGCCARPREWDSIGLAGPGAFRFAELTAFDQALDVVMVAVLGSPHLLFEAEHLGPVFAEGAVHVGVAAQHLRHPLLERIQDQAVISQIGSLEKFHSRMVRCHQVGVLADAAHQDAGKQEIWKDDDAAIAEPYHLAQAWFHQRERDPGIERLPPAEAEALHQHPRHLGHIGVGIRIRRSATDHHQQGVVQGYRLLASLAESGIGSFQRGADAGASRLNHLEVHPQLPAVIDAQACLGRIGVEHRGNVVLGMAGSEQHRRHRQHLAHPLSPQGLQPIAQDRSGEFEIAVFNGHRRQMLPQLLGQGSEFSDRQAIAAAVAADQHTDAAVGTVAGYGGQGRTRPVSNAGEGSHDPIRLFRPYPPTSQPIALGHAPGCPPVKGVNPFVARAPVAQAPMVRFIQADEHASVTSADVRILP